MTDTNKDLLQNLPGVDRMLEDDRIKKLLEKYPRTMVVDGIRDYLKTLRKAIMENETVTINIDHETILNEFVRWAENSFQRSLRRVINGTGVILNTGLGRAPLARTAQEALSDAVANYCLLQLDRETGGRGDRYTHIENLLKKITGAEAAMIVNNNAAATLLILNTLAGGKEVIVSRGELIEIGGSFRIPDIMKRSGAKMVEVGTTNRTHTKDYSDAITPETGLLLRVHQSNYKILGFSKIVPLAELVALARGAGLPLVDDLGSGALVDLSKWGLPKEPTAQESIEAGADVVCFSGDKLLGGPQCGVIIGKKEYIQRMKKNQLTRALRCDKMTFAVMEATLRLFLDEEKLLKHHPVIRMLTESSEDVKKRCMNLKRRLKKRIGHQGEISVIEDVSEVGSGSMAAETIPTWGLSLRLEGYKAQELARRLRLSDPPVFGRVMHDRYFLDCRTILHDELSFIVEAFGRLVKPDSPGSDTPDDESRNLAEAIAGEVREI